MTHTPWTVGRAWGGDLTPSVFADNAPEGAKLIAECYGPEADTHAALIAAVPSLIAFAEYVLEMDPKSDAPLFAKARAALAKAKEIEE